MLSSLVRLSHGRANQLIKPRCMCSAARPDLDELLRRLDALEARVNDAVGLGQAADGGVRQGAGQRGWGGAGRSSGSTSDEQQQQAGGKTSSSSSSSSNSSGSKGDQSVTEKAADKAAGMMEDAAADAVQKLHPALIKFLNSGYLVSQQQLRQRLMQIEWEGSLRLWAMRKGVAEFEQHLAQQQEEEGKEGALDVEWSAVQALYQNPEDLSPLDANPRARMLAHSLIQHAMLDKQLETYRACTDTAKELANVIESGQRTSVSTLFGAVRKLLPIPFLR